MSTAESAAPPKTSIYDAAGKLIEVHRHKGDLKECKVDLVCLVCGFVRTSAGSREPKEELRPPVSVETGMRGRRRIRTAEYWREYYRRKQREWRAVHLYGVSRKAVMRVFDECGKVTPPHGPDLNRLASEKVKESRWLRDLMHIKKTDLAAEVKRTRHLYIELAALINSMSAME